MKKLTLLFQTSVLLHLQGIWSSTEYVLLFLLLTQDYLLLFTVVHMMVTSPKLGFSWKE